LFDAVLRKSVHGGRQEVHLRLLICGFHNSIVDDLSLWYEIVCELYETYEKIPPSQDVFFYEYGLYGRWPHYAHDGVPLDNEVLEDRLSSAYRIRAEHVYLFDNIHTTFSMLRKRGVKIGIVTHQKKETVFEILKAHGIRQIVKDCFLCCEVPIAEKSEAILEICTRTSTHPRDCLFLGDSPYGLLQAKKAGVVTMAFMNDRIPPDLNRAVEPELEISFIEELVPFFTPIQSAKSVESRMGICPACQSLLPLTKHHVLPSIARNTYVDVTTEQKQTIKKLCWPCHCALHTLIKRGGGHASAKSIVFYIEKLEEVTGQCEADIRQILGIP
jgi:pyrophosphatase PpaX